MDSFLQKTLIAIEAALKRRNISSYKASKLAVQNSGMIRNMRSGSNPRLDNLKNLCDVLGLELYIGEPREHQSGKMAPLLGTFKPGKKIDSDVLAPKDFSNMPQIAPPPGLATPIAFEIGDDSFAPLLEKGDVIFTEFADWGKSNKQFESYIGKLCLVNMGETLELCILHKDKAGEGWIFKYIDSSLPDFSRSLNHCLPVKWIHKS